METLQGLPNCPIPYFLHSKSQKGAYKNLANAKKCADANPGYSVFNADGKVVYVAAAIDTESEPEAPAVPFLMKVGIGDLNIRTGPGNNWEESWFITEITN